MYEATAERNALVDRALERVNAVQEERFKKVDKKNLKSLWWREFFIIIAPLVLWMSLFLSVLLFWPSTQKLLEAPHTNSVYNVADGRVND